MADVGRVIIGPDLEESKEKSTPGSMFFVAPGRRLSPRAALK
jgi:hypothetical protein